MTAKDRLERLEKAAKVGDGLDNIHVTVIDSPPDGQGIEDQVRAKAIKDGAIHHAVYMGQDDRVKTYTYDPKLGLGRHG